MKFSHFSHFSRDIQGFNSFHFLDICNHPQTTRIGVIQHKTKFFI